MKNNESAKLLVSFFTSNLLMFNLPASTEGIGTIWLDMLEIYTLSRGYSEAALSQAKTWFYKWEVAVEYLERTTHTLPDPTTRRVLTPTEAAHFTLEAKSLLYAFERLQMLTLQQREMAVCLAMEFPCVPVTYEILRMIGVLMLRPSMDAQAQFLRLTAYDRNLNRDQACADIHEYHEYDDSTIH